MGMDYISSSLQTLLKTIYFLKHAEEGKFGSAYAKPVQHIAILFRIWAQALPEVGICVPLTK